MTAFAGGSHNLRFEQHNLACANFNVFLDDVSLEIAADIPWLSETPTTGWLGAYGDFESIAVTFDANALAAGVYTGTLRVASDTPYSPQGVPVELTVGTDYASAQDGNWTGTAWPGSTGTPTANDIVTVTTGTTVTVDSVSAQCYGLYVEPGGTLIIPQGSDLTVEGYVENHGKLVETKSVSGATEFLHLRNQAGDETHYYGATITPDGNMGQVEVAIRGNQACTTNGPDDTVNRCFDITPGTVQTADIRFFYLDAEIPAALDANTMQVWHWSGTYPWGVAGASYAIDSAGDYWWIDAQDVSGYSLFVISSKSAGPTALRLTGLTGQGGLLTVMLVFGLLAAGTLARRKRR